MEIHASTNFQKHFSILVIVSLLVMGRDDKASHILLVKMDLIHYSFAPLILFRVPYTLDLLQYYLSIANGAGGVGIFKLLVFQCFV